MKQDIRTVANLVWGYCETFYRSMAQNPENIPALQELRDAAQRDSFTALLNRPEIKSIILTALEDHAGQENAEAGVTEGIMEFARNFKADQAAQKPGWNWPWTNKELLDTVATEAGEDFVFDSMFSDAYRVIVSSSWELADGLDQERLARRIDAYRAKFDALIIQAEEAGAVLPRTRVTQAFIKQQAIDRRRPLPDM